MHLSSCQRVGTLESRHGAVSKRTWDLFSSDMERHSDTHEERRFLLIVPKKQEACPGKGAGTGKHQRKLGDRRNEGKTWQETSLWFLRQGNGQGRVSRLRVD